MYKHRVLIVAESPFHLALMADLLEANGVGTVRTRSAQEAADAVVAQPPTVVVLDLDLPEKAYESVLAKLKARPESRDVPVVVVGEHAQRAAADRILASRRGSRVAKPIDTAAFPRAVMQEIRRRTTGVAREAAV